MQDEYIKPNYFDLIKDEISDLAIKTKGNYNCYLINTKNDITYKGFKLAESKGGNAFTICDIDFQKSDIDRKYQPRLIFKKTNSTFEPKNTSNNSEKVIISFGKGKDGYS